MPPALDDLAQLHVQALNRIRNRHDKRGTLIVPAELGSAYGEPIRDKGFREHDEVGRPFLYDEPRARVSSWPPLRLARLRLARESVVVVSPTGSRVDQVTQETAYESHRA